MLPGRLPGEGGFPAVDDELGQDPPDDDPDEALADPRYSVWDLPPFDKAGRQERLCAGALRIILRGA